ncbi:unnamed protein product, partial [Porites evermanni]
KKSVLKLITSNYPRQDIFTKQESYDKEEYICKTCHSKMIPGKVPCQAFQGHVYFEAVRPETVMTALRWLEASNPLYKDVEINCSNIGLDLTNIASDNE